MNGDRALTMIRVAVAAVLDLLSAPSGPTATAVGIRADVEDSVNVHALVSAVVVFVCLTPIRTAQRCIEAPSGGVCETTHGISIVGLPVPVGFTGAGLAAVAAVLVGLFLRWWRNRSPGVWLKAGSHE